MSWEDMQRTGRDMLYLAICAIRGATPSRARVQAMDLSAVYDLAIRHEISAAVAMAAESAGFEDEQSARRIAFAVARMTLLDAERARVLERLDRAGIWHMPLKGAVMKEYYPRRAMREMSDIDILIDPARREDVRAIMADLGFRPGEEEEYYHDEYRKDPSLIVEMHWALFMFSSHLGRRQADYYQNVRERLVRDPDSACGCRFTEDDFYIYMVAHAFRHYIERGTGARMILDTCVYLERFGDRLNWAYIEGELEKLGASGFERQSRSLAGHLYRGEALTPADDELLDNIINAGGFGSPEQGLFNRLGKLDGSLTGKLKYVFRRVFPSMAYIEFGHPFFYRHRVLLPLLILWRLLKALTVYWPLVGRELRLLFRGQRQD